LRGNEERLKVKGGKEERLKRKGKSKTGCFPHAGEKWYPEF
jgi:hypothetical protein